MSPLNWREHTQIPRYPKNKRKSKTLVDSRRAKRAMLVSTLIEQKEHILMNSWRAKRAKLVSTQIEKWIKI